MHPDTELDDYSDLTESRVLTMPANLPGERLDTALAQQLPDYSRSRLANWIKQGRVLVNGQPCTPKDKLWGGELIQVDIEPDPDEVAFRPEEMALNIVYADEAIIVINKPAGLVVHPGSGNWSGTLLNGLLFHFPELKGIPRAGIVHRLDKETSGLMVVARTLQAQNHLVQQLQARSVKRIYLAIAQGELTGEGTVDAPIGRHPRERTKMAVVHTGKTAITHWQALEAFAQYTLVRCRLETGRTHQIRVHMAYIGHPLAADPVYGRPPKQPSLEVRLALETFARQALHARQLSLIHPVTGKTMQWRAPLPQDMTELLTVLRTDMGDLDEEWDDDWDEEDHCEFIYVRD